MLPTMSVLSLFPDALESVLHSSILRRAQAKGCVDIQTVGLRDYGLTRHQNVDDTPYGGGQGMLLRADVLGSALKARLERLGGNRERLKVIYTSPRGVRLEQAVVDRLANWLGGDSVTHPRELCVVCGRYEGVDERFVDEWVDLELSLGDFILSGGEIAALAVCDAVVRLMPGVLGNEKSAREDSFSQGLLEYPQFTRPPEVFEASVPETLMSGNHAEIARWRLRQSLLLTAAFRPDLILKHDGAGLDPWAQDLLLRLKERLTGRSD